MLNFIKKNANIVCVFGEAGSGKSTFIQTHFPDWKVISVSSIVKKLSGFKTRKNLTQTGDLDAEISRELIYEIFMCQINKENVIVDGIRQKSIYDSLQTFLGRYDIWLDVSKEIRRKRIEDRADKKDDISFDEIDQRDAQLGLTELKECLMCNDRTLIVKNY
jgi:predicted kinase